MKVLLYQLFMVIVFLVFSKSAFPNPIRDFYRGSEWNIFPIPIVKYSPAEGPTYGIMPVLTASDKEHLKSFIVLAETYNEITSFSTFAAYYLYPNDYTVITFFGEVATRHAREALFRYQSLPQGKGKKLFVVEFNYFQYPFERFFGFGPNTPKSNATNFVSQQLLGEMFGGYRFTDHFTVRLGFRTEDWKLLNAAVPSLPDTRTFFTGNNQVIDSLTTLEKLELTYDTHHNQFSRKGERASLLTFSSLDGLGSDFLFYGYLFHGKITRDFLGDRFTTVISAIFEQRFGKTIPFYQQSSLGGPEFLRAFVERRFTAKHRFSLDLEERIDIATLTLFDTKTVFSLDPFCSVGQVFNAWGEIEGNALQPVGGIGIRVRALPAVVGRLDVAVGREGVEAYATLDYPF